MVATSSPAVIRKEGVGFSSSLASGASETVEVYPPAGSQYITETMKVYIGPENDAASGDHKLMLKTWGNENVVWGDAAFDGTIEYNASGWKNYRNAQPTDPVAVQQAINLAFANENNPITIQHDNNTDVTYDETRYVTLFVREESF